MKMLIVVFSILLTGWAGATNPMHKSSPTECCQCETRRNGALIRTEVMCASGNTMSLCSQQPSEPGAYSQCSRIWQERR